MQRSSRGQRQLHGPKSSTLRPIVSSPCPIVSSPWLTVQGLAVQGLPPVLWLPSVCAWRGSPAQAQGSPSKSHGWFGSRQPSPSPPPLHPPSLSQLACQSDSQSQFRSQFRSQSQSRLLLGRQAVLLAMLPQHCPLLFLRARPWRRLPHRQSGPGREAQATAYLQPHQWLKWQANPG